MTAPAIIPANTGHGLAIRGGQVALDLVGPSTLRAAESEFWFTAKPVGKGTTWGNPQKVIAAVRSQLIDGSLGYIASYDNRTAVINLKLTATNGDALARGEAALKAALRFAGLGELIWTPPSALAEPAVFEIVWGDPEFELDDFDELQCWRTYTLTLECRPFARSLREVLVAATPAISTNIDDGSSTTGWSVINAPANVHNLCPNPSFETNAAGWSAGSGTSSIARSTALALYGSASLLVTVSGGTQSIVVSPLLTVAAGTTYTVSANFGIAAGFGSQGVGVGVFWYSDAGGTAQIGSDNSPTIPPFNPTAWRFRTAQFTAPAGAVTMRYNAYIYGSLNPGDQWYLDATSVIDKSGTGYFDGGVPASSAARTQSWDGTANNSTSTLTWTAPTLSVVSGKVQGKVYGVCTTGSASTRRAGAINMATLKYARIKGVAISGAGAAASTVTIADNGAAIAPVASSINPTSGAFDITVYHPTGFTTLDVIATFPGIGLDDYALVSADSVDILSVPVLGAFTKMLQFPVYGSVRTEGSLEIHATRDDSSAFTSETLLTYVCPADKLQGFNPALSTTRTAGPARTADANAASGAHSTLATSSGSADTYVIDMAAIPEGTYTLVMKLGPGVTWSGGTINWSAATAAGGVTDTGSEIIPASGLNYVSVAPLVLPTVRVKPGTSSNVTITIWADATGIVVDDFYLFWMAPAGSASADASGHLTLLDANGHKVVEIDSASVTDPRPSLWRDGVQVGDTGAILDAPILTPGTMAAYLVSAPDADITVAARYFARWDTHPASYPAEAVLL